VEHIAGFCDRRLAAAKEGHGNAGKRQHDAEPLHGAQALGGQFPVQAQRGK
jgi:hypothetical protein